MCFDNDIIGMWGHLNIESWLVDVSFINIFISATLGQVIVPEGDMPVDIGHLDLVLDCARSSVTEQLTWYQVRDGISSNIYNTVTGLQAEGFSVDESDPLKRSLTILEVTEELAGEYTCFITGETPQAMAFGTSNVSIIEGKILYSQST